MKVVRPSVLAVVVGVLVAAEVGSVAGTPGGAVARAVLAGLAVLALLAVAGHHRVEVGPAAASVSGWWSTVEVPRAAVESVRRGGRGRMAHLVVAGGDDLHVPVPPLVSARRVARALAVPLVTVTGETVDRRAEVRAMLWVLGGVVLAVALALALAASG